MYLCVKYLILCDLNWILNLYRVLQSSYLTASSCHDQSFNKKKRTYLYNWLGFKEYTYIKLIYSNLKIFFLFMSLSLYIFIYMYLYYICISNFNNNKNSILVYIVIRVCINYNLNKRRVSIHQFSWCNIFFFKLNVYIKVFW